MSLEADVREVDTRVDDLTRRIHNIEETLYGNGKPGMKELLQGVGIEVSSMRTTLLKQEHDKETQMVEDRKFAKQQRWTVGLALLLFVANLVKEFWL